MEAAVTTADWLRKSSAVPTANVACGCGAYCSTANILLWKEWRMLSGTCKWETKEIGKWSSGVVESVNLIGIRKRFGNYNTTGHCRGSIVRTYVSSCSPDRLLNALFLSDFKQMILYLPSSSNVP
nr:hypothetical protein Iba_chr09dCG3940 [Ipomoea batatas]